MARSMVKRKAKEKGPEVAVMEEVEAADRIEGVGVEGLQAEGSPPQEKEGEGTRLVLCEQGKVPRH